MAVSVKMGVDLGSFKSGIQEGQNILKGLNAEMKATEAEFKATGNAEKALEQKTKTLNSQLQVQKGIADQAKAALEAMDKAGIEPTDKAYQQMYATMMNATAGMNEAQAALNGLGASASSAAGQADQLTQSVNGIGKKISLDQVLTGVNAITTGLENAAKKAISLGEEIWNAVMSAAQWADDTATQAQMYGIDIDTFQRMQKLVVNGMDTTVDAVLKAQKKLKKNIGDENKGAMEAMEQLGISLTTVYGQGKNGPVEQAKDSLELFWEAGQKIMQMSDEYDKEDLAQKLFGRGWNELVPLFESYKTVEEYQAALEGVNVNSEKTVTDLVNMSDKVGELRGNLDTLSREVLGSLAPALTKVADSLNNVLQSVLDYLNTPEGQAMLQSLGDTVSSLFEDLTTVDPNSVLETLKSAFDSIKNGLTWIKDNKQTIIDALKAIGIAFGALKLSEMAINVWKFVDGARTLLNMGGGTDAVVTGAGTGATVGDMTLLSKAGALGITGVMMMAPAIISGIVRSVLPEDMQIDREAYVKAGTYSEDDIKKAREYASTQNEINELLEKSYSIGLEDQEQNRLEELSATHDALKDIVDSDLWDRYTKYLEANETEKGGIFDLSILDKMLSEIESEGGVPVKVDPQAEDGAAASLSEQIGTVTVPVRLEYAGGAGVVMPMKHANGLPFVPYDGYLAMLHRGERVMTASANRSYTYNNNNYFGNVNLNNGQDIDALCTSIDRHNRRMQSGFGA